MKIGPDFNGLDGSTTVESCAEVNGDDAETAAEVFNSKVEFALTINSSRQLYN